MTYLSAPVDHGTASEPLVAFDQPAALRLRILEQIVPQPDGCWQWQGQPSSNGYPAMRVHRHTYRAHRVSYSVFVSPFPERLYACHTCDNRMCVNPVHIFLGTAHDNMQDAGRKGRLSRPGTWGERHPNATIPDAEVERALELWRGGMSQRAVAEMFGVSQSAVSQWATGTVRGRRVS